jgi:hypothetical protein
VARANLKIVVGKYTGTGVDNRNITDLDHTPQFVAIKSGAQNAVFRTKEMRGDITGFLASSNASLTDRIQALIPTGFQLGTTGQVNTNAAVYYYFTIWGASSQNYFRTGNYMGDGNDSRNFTDATIGFTPDVAIIQKYVTGSACVFRTSTMTGDTAGQFSGSGNASNIIQNLQANGFQLGTDATANTASTEYLYTLLKACSGAIAVGSFTGTGVARSITGIGFRPSLVIVKNQNTADQARILTDDMVTDAQSSLYMGTTAADATGITSLDSDGFTVSTGASVNGSGNTVHWIALKEGAFNVPLVRRTS